MTADRGHAPTLPPRWFVRIAWVLHRAMYALTGGRLGLWRPDAGKRFGTLRLQTLGRRSGQPRVAILGYYEDGPNLVRLAGVAEITPDTARAAAALLPVVVHIVTAAVFAVLGAFQFVAGFRRRRSGWHRAAGKLLVACGLLVGLSGVWLALFYPRVQNVGDLLSGFRFFFGSAMLVSIVLGFTAIRRGNVRGHRAWMTRAYAIGLGAGTQMFTGLFASLLVSPPTELSRALQDGAGWAINLAVAEWAIRRRPAPPPLAAGKRPIQRRSALLSGGTS